MGKILYLLHKIVSFFPKKTKKVFYFVRRHYYMSGSDVIAITGSCGKTSATYFLSKIISEHAFCYVGIRKNTAKGIKQNIRKVRSRYRFYLQESGVAYPGDMKKIVSNLRPRIGVVTTIGRDHHTSFRTLEGTAAEKGILIESLPRGGTAVLNADDSYVLAMGKKTRARVLSYGLSDNADVRGGEIRASWPHRLSLSVTFQDETVRLDTGLFGDLLVTSLLAAVAGGIALGFSLEQCVTSLRGVEAFPARLSIHQSSQGAWIIRDTVKAPFWTVKKVLLLLKDAAAPRKTIVIGSFSDTPGSDSSKYRRMARVALDVADRVVFVGRKSTYIKKMQTPLFASRLFVYESLRDACLFLASTAIENELVLLKSNINSHLERLIFGQEDGCSCWKDTCDKKINCEECQDLKHTSN